MLVIFVSVFCGGGFGMFELEIFDNFSVGVVWMLSFIDLSVVVDYFDIEINDEIMILIV